MSLILQLAVGRLVQESGEYAHGKHQLIATLLADSSNPMKNTYSEKLKQIMNKAKEIPDKRVRMTTNDNEFEIHLLPYNVDEDCRIIFFAITDPSFSSSFDIADLFTHFKSGFLDMHEDRNIKKAKAGGRLNKDSKELLRKAMEKYGESKLTKVQRQVDEVKNVMNDNLTKALDTSLTIEQMDKNAAEMEDHAGKFKKKAVVVKREARKKFWQTNLFLALICGVILLIIIIAIAGAVS